MSAVAPASSTAPPHRGVSPSYVLSQGFFLQLHSGISEKICDFLLGRAPAPPCEELKELLVPPVPLVLCLDARLRDGKTE